MKKFAFLAATLLMGAASVSTAHAATIALNFAGLNGPAEESVNTYYAGGVGSDGSGPGPNYGITFTSNGIVCSTNCNTNEIPGGTGANILFFLSGAAATMDVAGGFTTGFSFYYSAVNDPGVINVWSGLDDTGTLLATLDLPTTPNAGDPGCNGANFCPFVETGVTFLGTAQSVDFGGTENQVAFADVTLGSSTASTGAVPEPGTWALMLVGFGMVGMAMRKRANVRTTVSYT